MVAMTHNNQDETVPNECPFHDVRKTSSVQPSRNFIHVDDEGKWHLEGFSVARQVLRSTDTIQEGFAAPLVRRGIGQSVMKNPPILYLDGEPHNRARRETNRFFTPSITSREYHDFMEKIADDLVTELKDRKRWDLSDLSMTMAVKVASKIVGLTSSPFPKGAKARLEEILGAGNQITEESGWWTKLKSNLPMLSFYFLDVRPAIQARRQQPQEDVISYLLERGYNDAEIITECVVYGVAGMVTTREFISVVLWHLLENDHLKERMLVGEEKERYSILHEILRLEPVVTHLYRRTTSPVDIEHDGETVTIPSDTFIHMSISTANVDQSVMGEDSLSICPGREMTKLKPRVGEYALSFGDGAHRCPGAFVAIQETDILIRKLLQIPTLRLISVPKVGIEDITKSYEIRNVIIAAD